MVGEILNMYFKSYITLFYMMIHIQVDIYTSLLNIISFYDLHDIISGTYKQVIKV